jgi:hypothetical protein
MITQGLVTSFKVELLTATHNFTPTTGDTFYLALYTQSATLNADTTVYTTSGEVVASGYTAGGIALTSIAPTSSGDIAFTSFNDVTFTASITANGALIYNSTKSNKAVAVLAFGADKTSTPTFVVTFPTFSSTTAIIRIV